MSEFKELEPIQQAEPEFGGAPVPDWWITRPTESIPNSNVLVRIRLIEIEIQHEQELAHQARVAERERIEEQKRLEEQKKLEEIEVTGDKPNWDPILLALVRRAMPSLIAYDICGVQPMTGPTGLVFAMKAKYDKESNESKKPVEKSPFFEESEWCQTPSLLSGARQNYEKSKIVNSKIRKQQAEEQAKRREKMVKQWSSVIESKETPVTKKNPTLEAIKEKWTKILYETENR